MNCKKFKPKHNENNDDNHDNANRLGTADKSAVPFA